MDRENGSPVKNSTKLKRGKKGRPPKLNKLSSESAELPMPTSEKPLEALCCDEGKIGNGGCIGECVTNKSDININGMGTGPLWRDCKSSLDIDGESTGSRISNDENLMPPPVPQNLNPSHDQIRNETSSKDIDQCGDKCETNSSKTEERIVTTSANEVIIDGFSIFNYSSEQEVTVS